MSGLEASLRCCLALTNGYWVVLSLFQDGSCLKVRGLQSAACCLGRPHETQSWALVCQHAIHRHLNMSDNHESMEGLLSGLRIQAKVAVE